MMKCGPSKGTNIRSRRSFVSTLSKTLPRQSVIDQVEPERRVGRTVCEPGHDVKSKRVDDGDLRAGQTLPVSSALKLPLFLSVGPERRIILSGSRPH